MRKKKLNFLIVLCLPAGLRESTDLRAELGFELQLFIPTYALVNPPH